MLFVKADLPFALVLCSWGTKGDTTLSTDLGIAKSTGSKQGVETVEVELPTEEKDINEAYEEFLADLRKKLEKKHQVSAHFPCFLFFIFFFLCFYSATMFNLSSLISTETRCED